jgi:hypothetical protein
MTVATFLNEQLTSIEDLDRVKALLDEQRLQRDAIQSKVQSGAKN